MKIAQIAVELIDSMGDDLRVVNAARVSHDKESKWENVPFEMADPRPDGTFPTRLSDKDAKLIKYLVEHNHWTPFAHCFASFCIKAPIFVARQLVKHQVGLAWNEVSRRYVDTEPEFWFPKVWRERPESNIKQGSGGEHPEQSGGAVRT
ncbi:FAD-dependent thymidylate synthase [Accumulibacter sp.]|uniref:FAD-dependent thymidylate synthase n=1 Tax=Accumulibacter sp. TaxID=2053492 RepID=UPI00258BE43A|nr:FAD-dependent thymidylate synthase [Accumulibacter sp.]